MKYIIMCGCKNDDPAPKHITVINGEPIVQRTIRLLRENNIEDISISSNNPVFEQFRVPVLHHSNAYYLKQGTWVDGFYLVDEPVCYLFGDVVFSPDAIEKIIKTKTDDIEFFASAPPFAKNYFKPYAEPFAFKVQNNIHFRESLVQVRTLKNKFKRPPIAWELWQVIKGTPLNTIDYTNYTVINDYTCDVDHKKDIELFEHTFNNL